MKAIKFILLTVAFAVSAMGFAQKNGTAFSFNGKKVTNSYFIQKDRVDRLQKPETLKAGQKQAFGTIMKRQVAAFNKAGNLSLRAASAGKQCLDSISGYNGEYYYKSEYSYNDKGYVTEQLQSSRDFPEEAWDTDKTVYEYGANEYQTKSVEYTWYNSDWAAYSKAEYTYNEYGKIASEIYYYRDYEEGTDWEFPTKYEYTYVADGRLQSTLTCYEWDGKTWVENDKEKSEYTFDASGYPTEGKTYTWYYEDNYDEGEWKLYQKQAFEFDATGNQIKYSGFYDWNFDGNWDSDYTIKYTYNTDGLLISEETTYNNYDEDHPSSSKDKYEYQYDANGNIKTIISNYSYTYDGETNHSNVREDYTFDLSYLMSDMIYPIVYFDEDFFGGYGFKNKLTSIKTTGDDGSSYTTTLYWSDTPVSNAVIKNGSSSLIVYPNPTEGQLRITNYELQNSKVEVFDAMGRSVKTENVNAGVIDVSSLPAGLYFLKIGAETVKIFKK
jgi:hypothetical protein